MDIDLNSLSLKELKSLQNSLSKAIATFEDRRKREALVQLEEKARELGFTSLSELTGGAPLRKRSISEAKFANPADASDTWSGRGRKPRWYIDAIASGKTEEDLAI